MCWACEVYGLPHEEVSPADRAERRKGIADRAKRDDPAGDAAKPAPARPVGEE